MATVRTAPSTGRSAPHPGDTAGCGRRPEAVRGAAGRACAGRRRSERECFDASLYNPNNKSIAACLSCLLLSTIAHPSPDDSTSSLSTLQTTAWPPRLFPAR